MKKLFAVVLVLAMMSALMAGCGGNSSTPATTAAETTQAGGSSPENAGSEPAKKDLHFVYVSPLLSHPVWLIAKDGFDQAVKELGIKGDWVGPQNISPEEMTKLVETAIAQKADAIITQGLVPATPLKLAEEANIPVLIVDSDIPDAKKVAFFGKDIDVQSKLLVESMEKRFGKDTKLTIGVMVAAFNYAIAQQQIDALEAALKNHPGGYEIIAKAESKSDKLKATTEWQNVLNANPSINVCANFAAEAGPAAAKVVQEMKLGDKVAVYAVDDVQETLDLVKSGAIEGTVVTSFFNYGYQAAYWLYQHITEGKNPEKVENDAGTIMVTKDNVETYNDVLKKKVDLK